MATKRTAAIKLPNPVKVRNPLVVPTLKRKSGKHTPDPKGTRRDANRAAREDALSTEKIMRTETK